MNKTVASVIDDINEWPNPHGGFIYFVTAIFTDESVGSVGRKDHDAALEVQGLLREAIGQEQDFVLEPKGQTKGGRDKFKILGFGTPGGAATYTAPGVQGGSGSEPGRGLRPQTDASARRPEPSSEQASIRAAVAVKAAVELGGDINTVLENADVINAWMFEKTSEPALSAYGTAVEDDNPVRAHQTGASSEDSSAGGPLGPPFQPPADSAGSQESPDGEAGGSAPHVHDWYSRQGVPKFLVCDCGATRKKEAAAK